MPKIVCNDGYIRRFYPATGVGSHLRISMAKVSPAYCEECGQTFRIVESKLQIDDWKKHICNTDKLKKFQPKNKSDD